VWLGDVDLRMGPMLAPILGPTLGGHLTELYNWRYATTR
jgi:hypothetical protein